MKKVILLLVVSVSFTFNLCSQAIFNSYELEYEFENKISISFVGDKFFVFNGRPEPETAHDQYLLGVYSADSSFTFFINPGEILDLGYHDAYYDIYYIPNTRRKITLHRTNGQVDVYYRNTGNRAFEYDGDLIYRVDVSAPTLEGLYDYPKGYKEDQVVINDGTRDGGIPVYDGPDYLK